MGSNMEQKYSMSIFWSADDEAFIALSPDFPGMSAFGDSPREAAREAESALSAMAESLLEDGVEPPAPRLLPKHSGQLRIRISKSLHTRLALEAERQGVSLNSLMAGLLERGLARAETASGIQKELDELKDLIHSAFSYPIAQAQAGKGEIARPAAPFPGAGASTRTAFTLPLTETRAVYGEVKQLMPQVYIRRDTCMSN